jgi:hypothetical protein
MRRRHLLAWYRGNVPELCRLQWPNEGEKEQSVLLWLGCWLLGWTVRGAVLRSERKHVRLISGFKELGTVWTPARNYCGTLLLSNDLWIQRVVDSLDIGAQIFCQIIAEQ